MPERLREECGGYAGRSSSDIDTSAAANELGGPHLGDLCILAGGSGVTPGTTLATRQQFLALFPGELDPRLRGTSRRRGRDAAIGRGGTGRCECGITHLLHLA